MSEPHTWELLRRGRAAAALPYDPVADRLLLIEQFRLPACVAGIDPVLIETPAGLCDPGETPEVTAHRELREETGLGVDRLKHIADALLSPGAADERVSIFVGRARLPEAGPDGLIGYAGVAGEGEDIRLRSWTAVEAIAAAFDGRIVNSVTLIALLWFASRHQALRQEWLER
jgi:ADP-ribose pyrophosphatase